MSLDHKKAAELQRMLLVPAFFGTTAVFFFQTAVHDVALWSSGKFDQSLSWTIAKYLFAGWIVVYVCTSFIVPSAKPNEYSGREFLLDTLESLTALVALAALGFADVFAGDVVFEHPKFAYSVVLLAVCIIALHAYWRRPAAQTSIHVKIARGLALALSALGFIGVINAGSAESANTVAVVIGVSLWLVLLVYAYVHWTDED